jgi:hypothetical protein
MSDIMRNLVGKVDRRVRKSWPIQEMISKVDEQGKWKKVTNEEGRNETMQ